MKYEDIPAGCLCDWVEDRSISTAPEDGEWTLTHYNVRCEVHKPKEVANV